MLLKPYNCELFNITDIVVFIVIIIYRTISITYYIKVVDIENILVTAREYIKEVFILSNSIIMSKHNNIRNIIIYER